MVVDAVVLTGWCIPRRFYVSHTHTHTTPFITCALELLLLTHSLAYLLTYLQEL